jgi:two-component system, cell cycle sensor histidine kinase and response regulator CckA
MSAARNTETRSSTLIYLVDDEDLMLDLAEVALLGYGYEIRKFTNPTEALQAFSNEIAKPALLLTDYAMGAMNGIELSEKCRAECPDLKILMLSGTISEEATRNSAVRLDGFIAKPYSPSSLASTVKSLLT